MKETYQNFGEFLQQKRVDRGITLRAMAERLGVSAPYLSDVEKDRRNPMEMEKLDLISRILMLTVGERNCMLDLAGRRRNTIAPDIPAYIMPREYVAVALRTARDLDADEADWMRFVQELRERKG